MAHVKKKKKKNFIAYFYLIKSHTFHFNNHTKAYCDFGFIVINVALIK